MKVAIVGGGSMGLAFAKRWLDQLIVKPDNLLIIETSPDRRMLVEKELGITPTADIQELAQAQVIFIAVKPQDFKLLAASLAPLLSSEKLVISIMAGVPIKDISLQLANHSRIVRAMPNLPIVVGKGLLAYIA